MFPRWLRLATPNEQYRSLQRPRRSRSLAACNGSLRRIPPLPATRKATPMSIPCPDHQEDQSCQRLQCAFPAVCVFFSDQFPDLRSESDVLVDEITYDAFGNLVGLPLSSQGPYDFDPNCMR